MWRKSNLPVVHNFKKAYDMVDHKILFEKMTELNIGRRVTNLKAKLYKKTEMRVKDVMRYLQALG